MSGAPENLSSPEELPVETKVLDSADLKDLVYGNGSLPEDKRFSHFEEGGVFKYFLPETLDRRGENKFYPVVIVGGEIAGISELEKSPYQENRYWVKFMSVDPKYQGRGYASMLAEEIFKFVKLHDAELQLSLYTKDGEMKLRKVLERLSEEYSIPLIPHIETQN